MPYYPPPSTGGGAPTNATYILQTANGSLASAQALGSLSTGLATVTNSTGVVGSVTAPAGTVVGTTDTQTVSGKILSDAFMGNAFNSQSALVENLTLAASTNYTYDNLLEIGASNTLEIPATSTLEIEAYIDQPYVNNTLGIAPDANNTFISQSATAQNITLPSAIDYLSSDIIEIGAGSTLEIPRNSTLEIAGYARQSGSTVGTAALLNASVTADKLSPGSQTVFVATSESTTSGAYTDLTTTTDTVTATIGANGLALVFVQAEMDCLTSGIQMKMSVALSGANTVVAGGTNTPEASYGTSSTVNIENTKIAHSLMTGLTPGVTTFKAKYLTGGAASGFFQNRRVTVIPF